MAALRRRLHRSAALAAASTVALLAATPAIAQANATFVCDSGAHNYTASAGHTLVIDAQNGDSYCTMAGTIPQGATVVIEHGAGVSAGASAENDGVLQFDGGTSGFATAGTLINTGTLQVTAGAAQVNAATVQNSGVINLPSDTSIAFSGRLTLLASSTLALGINGKSASNIGSLTAGGPATLGGTLDIVPATGFTPTAGSSQLVLTAFSVSGHFAKTKGGNDSGFFTTNYAPDTVTIETSAPAIATIGKVSNVGEGLTVRVSCPRGTLICSPVTLTAASAGRHPVTVASAKVSLNAGQSKVLTLRLNSAGQKRYVAAGKLKVHVVATAAGKKLSRQTVTLAPVVKHGGG